MAGIDEILGRDAEVEAIDRFFNGASSARVLFLRGVPGIGKTTLWRASIERASELGYEIMSTRPTESEATFSYMGLGDLLEDLGDDVLDGLPAPQRIALEVVLLRAEAPPEGVDHRTICVAVLGALRASASGDPLLIAIDDVQWLDGSTALVLEYAARRLANEPIRFVAAMRAATDASDPASFIRRLGAGGVQTIDVGELSADAIGGVVKARLDTTLPKPTLDRLLEVSGGNPFFALEIARVLIAGRLQLEHGRMVSMPSDLADLLPSHIAELPEPTQRMLLFCAAASTPTTALLRSAVADPDRVPSDLAQAVSAGVVELDGDRIRFTHPLLSSAVYSDATEDRRREVHGRLAEVLTDPEERARHAALAAEGPDADVAVELEAAARLARQRGALGAAADLCMLAADLTPQLNAPGVRRLRLQAADDLLIAGDAQRSRDISRTIVETAPPGPERAEALFREARASFYVDHPDSAQRELGEALLEPGLEPELLSAIHRDRAWYRWQRDLHAAERDAEEAVRLAEASGDPTLVASGLEVLIVVRTFLGSPVPDDLMAKALEADEAADPLFVFDRPKAIFAVRRALSGGLDEARDILLELLDEAAVRGDEASASDILGRLGWVEHLAGNWEASLSYQERSANLSGSPDPLMYLAPIRAPMGDVDRAANEARRGLDHAPTSRDIELEIGSRAVLGSLDLSSGDPGGAHEQLRIAWELHQRWGFGDPGPWFLFVPDHVESLVELERYEEAAQVLDWLEERGRALERPWALAVAARYRGLLAAARGDLPAALEWLDEAMGHHDGLPMPFELARTYLIQGTIRRRAKQKRPAREAIERALEIFERVGAPLWADRAKAELSRVSGRRAAAGELTTAERSVARLAAAGRTNQEIAEAMFLSPRTVGGHLSHVYAKLGIRSRTELGLFPELLEDPRQP
jgi:DNA-binding CsgD family transcriptional regulator